MNEYIHGCNKSMSDWVSEWLAESKNQWMIGWKIQ